MAAFGIGTEGKDTSGVVQCCGGKTNCGVGISGTLTPLSTWCQAPQTLYLTITGTSDAGQAINYATQIKPTLLNGNYIFSVSLTGATIPDGKYSLHIYEYGTNACQTGAGPTGRFDLTQQITVKCGNPGVQLVLPAQFDTIGPVSSNMQIQACSAVYPRTANADGSTCYGDVLKLSVATQISGGTICASTVGSDGNVTLTLKVTSYPASVGFTGTAPSCTSASQSTTWTGCNQSSSTNSGGGNLYYTKYPIQAFGCPIRSGALSDGGTMIPIAGATVTLSGFYNGSGTTNANSSCPAFATVTIDPTATDTSWTVSKDRFVTASFSQSAMSAALRNQQAYAGTFCPAGGQLTVAPGFYCGGCPGLPLPATLHATIAGGAVTLTYQDNVGWVGIGSFTMMAEDCTDDDPRISPPITASSGPVQFRIQFNYALYSGNNMPVPASPQVIYSCNSAGYISHCPLNLVRSQQNACVIGCASPSSYTASCDTFFESGACQVTLSYRSPQPDGSIQVINNTFNYQYTITE